MNEGRNDEVWNTYLHSEIIDLVEQGADERLVQFRVVIRIVEIVHFLVLCGKR